MRALTYAHKHTFYVYYYYGVLCAMKQQRNCCALQLRLMQFERLYYIDALRRAAAVPNRPRKR